MFRLFCFFFCVVLLFSFPFFSFRELQQPTLLDQQYRMHPKIAEFPSRRFYSGLLKSMVESKNRPLPKGFDWPNEDVPVAFIDVSHKDMDLSLYMSPYGGSLGGAGSSSGAAVPVGGGFERISERQVSRTRPRTAGKANVTGKAKDRNEDELDGPETVFPGPSPVPVPVPASATVTVSRSRFESRLKQEALAGDRSAARCLCSIAA